MRYESVALVHDAANRFFSAVAAGDSISCWTGVLGRGPRNGTPRSGEIVVSEERDGTMPVAPNRQEKCATPSLGAPPPSANRATKDVKLWNICCDAE